MKNSNAALIRKVLLAIAISILTAACASHKDDVRENPSTQGAAESKRASQPSPQQTAAMTAVTDASRPEAQEILVAPQAQLDAPAPASIVARGLRTNSANGDLARVVGIPTDSYPPPPAWSQIQNTENYQTLQENPVHRAAEQPVSTFSIDVDTGSYANVRRFLNAGELPPEEAVRVEEMLNYFDYDYPAPASRDPPFRVSTELAPAPWNAQSQLLRIGIKGYAIPAGERPASNLVFLVDVSGSMQSPDKLPLLKNAFRLLTQQLSAADRVSMVVYAGASGIVLEPTPGDRKQKILAALSALEAGGSTNGAAGITQAYDLARQAFIKGGINRVILATDGDFNVGTVNFEALVDMAERERASGIALTTLGFGTGNYNEKLLERLADAGNGNYAYVDTLSEARKVLVEELSSTLFTIARDVKVQVEFNPAAVAEYRLIGYENRILDRGDFNNDKVDAGDIGAGHRVTALYEVVPVGNRGLNDPLRYGGPKPDASQTRQAGELAFVRLRYKAPDSSKESNESKLIEFPVMVKSLLAAGQTSPDFRFAASVAAFGQKLRGGKYLGEFGYKDIRDLARPALDKDQQGYRREFLALVDLASTLQPQAGDAQKAARNDAGR